MSTAIVPSWSNAIPRSSAFLGRQNACPRSPMSTNKQKGSRPSRHTTVIAHTHTSHVVPGQRTLIRQGHAGTTTYRVRVSRWLVVFLAASATMPSLSIMGRSERTVCTHKWSCDAASQTSNTVCMSKLGGHILFRSKYARPRKNCHAASPHRGTNSMRGDTRQRRAQSIGKARAEQSRAQLRQQRHYCWLYTTS